MRWDSRDPLNGEKQKIYEEGGKKQKIFSSPCQSSSSSSQSDKEEDCVVHKKVRIISKAEQSRWELPEDMTKYANKFFQKYIPENDFKKNIKKGNPAPTNIGRLRDVDDSSPAATSVK